MKKIYPVRLSVSMTKKEAKEIKKLARNMGLSKSRLLIGNTILQKESDY